MRLPQSVLVLYCLFLSVLGSYAQEPVSVAIDETKTNMELQAAIGLPNGISAFLTHTDSNQLKLDIVNSKGEAVRSVNITNQVTFPNKDPYRTAYQAVATHSGNIFIAYHSTTTYGMLTKDIKYIVVDEFGELKNSGTVNTSDFGIDPNRFVSMASLSTGNLVISWLSSDNATYAYRMFRSDGTAMTDTDIPFAGPETSNTFDANSIYDVKLAASNKGGFLATVYSTDGKLSALLFKEENYNQVPATPQVVPLTPTSNTAYQNTAAIGLTNGNYGLVWQLLGKYYYKSLSTNGDEVVAPLVLPFSQISAVVPNRTKEAEGMVIAAATYEHATDNTNPLTNLTLYQLDNEAKVMDTITGYTGTVEARPVLYTGLPAGFGFAYSYYKTYVPHPAPIHNNSYYTLTSDRDIKATMYNITDDASYFLLPVTVYDWKGKLQYDGSVQLTWKSAHENEKGTYEIQKSTDGKNFTTLIKMVAKKSAETSIDYSYVDTHISTGKNYYRLVQTAPNEKGNRTTVVVIDRKTIQAAPAVYPNPFTGDYISISFSNPSTTQKPYTILDMKGAVVKRGNVFGQQYNLATNNLAKGMYLLLIAGTEAIKIEKR